ncbi:MAG: aspartate/glutamate racemase family protein [Spirochaetota bacterium]
MKIRIIAPIITDQFNREILKEAAAFKSEGTQIDVVNLKKGPASIESFYDDVLASPHIVEEAVRAQKEGRHAVFIDCFGDPGVAASREMVAIPVAGGFQPAALTASLISSRWSVITILKRLAPAVRENAGNLGVEANIASIRSVDIPVLELSDKEILQNRLLQQIEQAVQKDGAQAVVLGCTGMIGLAGNLQEAMKKKGVPVPVVDPTAAAIGYLELLVRSGISQSKITYPFPPEKERRI